MDENKEKGTLEETRTEEKVNENGGIMAEGHIRIFDPETGEEFVNQRSDG